MCCSPPNQAVIVSPCYRKGTLPSLRGCKIPPTRERGSIAVWPSCLLSPDSVASVGGLGCPLEGLGVGVLSVVVLKGRRVVPVAVEVRDLGGNQFNAAGKFSSITVALLEE
jgi:hypothetical protein